MTHLARRARPSTILRLRIAGLTLSVRSNGSGRSLTPPPAYRPFLTRRGDDVALELVDRPVPRPGRPALLFSSRGAWRVYRWEGGLLYQFRSPACDPRLYKAVWIDTRRRRGRLYFPRPHGRGPRLALDHPLDELLFQHRLAQDGGVEVHALGLVVRGSGVILCGHSGAGKSTSALVWRRQRPGVSILNDDRVVLRLKGRGVRVFGTPWHGDLGVIEPGPAPLAAVFFLRQARTTRVSRLAPAEAAARLFAHSFFPPWEAETVQRTLDACSAVTAGVPCYLLRFRPDLSAVEAVERELAALGRGPGGRRSGPAALASS